MAQMTLFSAFRFIAALIVFLFLFVGISVYQMNAGYKEEHEAINQQRELESIGQQLANGSDYLTDEIRRYVQFGDRVHFDNFWREVHETRSRDKAVERLKELKVLPSELTYIEKAKGYSDNLIKTEEAAMAAVEKKDFDRARHLVFGSYYDEQKKLIMGNIKKFQEVVNFRAAQETLLTRNQNSNLIKFSNILLVFSGGLVLFGFYIIGIRRLVNPIKDATQMMLELARDNIEVKIPAVKQKNEIGDIYSALEVFKENFIKRKQAEKKLYQEESLKQLLQTITVSANESKTFEEVAQTCLTSVCLAMGWPVGHVYVLNEKKKELTPTKLWYVENREKFKNFVLVTEQTPFKSGRGLPGRVLANSKPAWIDDVTVDKNFPRAQLANEIGVRAGFAFPVVIEEQTVAVLEFYSPRVEKCEDQLLETMNTVGIQIGRVIERQRSEKTLEGHLKNLERLVKERTEALELSNASLKDFVAIASHDLQEPLRKVVLFGDRLRDKTEDIDTQALGYIDRMQNATMRMQELINDLLNYSKVTTAAHVVERININEVIKESLFNLESRISETKGTVNVGEIPDFVADPVQILHLFQNLIGNSLKYHREDVAPVINIYSHSSDDGKLQIMVEDNGIGFDEKYSEKIFKPFERLHAKSDFGGTGMGLAICKNIVDRHNGTIDIKSTPNKGTIFTLNFPENLVEAFS